MHNVPPDQIQKNIRLIQLVQKYPCIYNPAIASSAGAEAVESSWQKIAQEINDTVEMTKKKWRLLRSSLLRYLKVFKDKATSKGNSYRPYYLLKHMEFLMPFIDDKAIVKRTIKEKKIAPPQMLIKKDVQRTVSEEQVIYTTTTSSPNGLTYSVTQVETSPSISSKEPVKSEHIHQDIQQFYNQAHHHAVVSSGNVKIIGEDFIYQAQPGAPETQLITYGVQQQDTDQNMEEQSAEQQETTQECISEQMHESQEQQHMQQIQDANTSLTIKADPQQTQITTIPLPHFNNSSISCGNMTPNDTADIYFLIGLLPDFRSISSDKKRKLKIGILKLIDDAMST